MQISKFLKFIGFLFFSLVGMIAVLIMTAFAAAIHPAIGVGFWLLTLAAAIWLAVEGDAIDTKKNGKTDGK